MWLGLGAQFPSLTTSPETLEGSAFSSPMGMGFGTLNRGLNLT